jgi:transposase-like protein
MSDWLKKIGSLIQTSSSAPQNDYTNHDQSLINTQLLHKLNDIPHAFSAEPKMTVNTKESEMPSNQEDDDENIKALKRLRDLPRGTHVESRIAAIKNLLGDIEVFKTLKMLRWPQGVICPRCQSAKVIRKDAGASSDDDRHFYICLNCKDDGSISDFDDFTGLPINSIAALRQWILCWYLIGFCSVSQIAKVLGVSIQQVVQMATQGTELTQLSSEQSLSGFTTEKSRDAYKRQRAIVDDQEDRSRSASKAPLKPGKKSKF